MKKLNILIGKIGKSVKFKNIDMSTGDDTCTILFSTMARMLPECNFYMIGPSDLKKTTEEQYDYLFPNHNVIDVFTRNKESRYMYEDIPQYFIDNKIDVDFALIFNGVSGTTNITNFLTIGRVYGSDNFVKQMTAFKQYAAPYIYTLNKIGCPYYPIAEDARYVTNEACDLYNRERVIFSQIDGIVKTRGHITTETDWTIVKSDIPIEYMEMEKIFLMAIDPKWVHNFDVERKINNTTNPKCIVISNGHGVKKLDGQHSVKDNRLPEYKKYIIDGLADTEYASTVIYGKWTEENMEKFPDKIKNVKFLDLGEEVADAKYTLIYSIVKDFVTIKPYEMIVNGILPFIHPDYDSKRVLGLPEFLYVNSPKDFVEKMRELDKDPEKYKDLLRQCCRLITPGLRDGSYLINKLMNRIDKDLNFGYEDHNGVPPILNHFSKEIFKKETNEK